MSKCKNPKTEIEHWWSKIGNVDAHMLPRKKLEICGIDRAIEDARDFAADILAACDWLEGKAPQPEHARMEESDGEVTDAMLHAGIVAMEQEPGMCPPAVEAIYRAMRAARPRKEYKPAAPVSAAQIDAAVAAVDLLNDADPDASTRDKVLAALEAIGKAVEQDPEPEPLESAEERREQARELQEMFIGDNSVAPGDEFFEDWLRVRDAAERMFASPRPSWIGRR